MLRLLIILPIKFAIWTVKITLLPITIALGGLSRKQKESVGKSCKASLFLLALDSVWK